MKIHDAEAREMFRNLAASLGLKGEFVEPPSDLVDVMFEMPAQSGLDFLVSLSLQNGDELNWHAQTNSGGWQFCYFPYEREESEFRRDVADFFTGKSRVVETLHNGSSLRAELQVRSGNESEGWEARRSSAIGFR